MKNFKRNINGTTLIALVITIIVLLILAGITINLILGDNGIISRAIERKTIYSNSNRKRTNIFSL